MDANTLIELAAKMVESLGMLADNQDRIAQNLRPTYGGRAFHEMAEEIRKMAMRTVTALPEESKRPGGGSLF